MDTYWAWEYGTGDKKNAIELVRAADAQRALDAEREKAKQLGRTLADVYQQRDGLQAQLRQVEGELAAMKGATNASS